MNSTKIKDMLKRASLLAATVFCLHHSARAQGDQGLQSVFNRYSQKALQEKIFVHTDKSTYLAGEIIWFKIYCVDNAYNQPLTLSKVVYVDVLDKTQTSVMQAKIAMKNGTGSGSLVVPSSITNGNYKLRAYTNWMKNFGPESFFEKAITIINPLRTPEPTAKIKAPDYDVQFFPEGGNLVAGLPANVAFKALGKNGQSVAFKGAIINERNDTVARFQPLKFGMGHFAFTPVTGNTYRAEIRVGGKPSIVAFPAINPKGYTMQLTDAGNGTLNVTVNTNAGDGPAYLFAQTRGLAKLAQTTNTNNGTAVFAINKDKLGDGITQLTIFDADRHPVCERLYFKRPKQGLFVDAAADAQQYITRKKVSVNIAAKDAGGKMLASGLSMSVFRIDSLQTADQQDIMSYFWLGSELKGNVESPGYYLTATGPEVDEATDNLLLTQGWRRFRWDNVLAGNAPAFKFLPEYNGHLIMGRVTDASQKAAQDVTAYLAVPGKRVQFFPAKSNADGMLYFNTSQLYGASEVVVQTNTAQDTTHKLEILSPFAEQYSATALPSFDLTPGMQGGLTQQSLGMQVQNIYAGNKLNHYNLPTVDSAAFFGKPYKTYKLDDFTRFVTMEEVVREYVREASVSKARGRFHITIMDDKTPLIGDPLVIVDGVPVFDLNKLMTVDPLKVQRLQVMRNRYFWGPTTFGGIMNFTTYKGDLGGTEIDPHALVVDYEGMQIQREFYSPTYDNEEQLKSRMPDFRNLLFWSPDIKTGTQTASKVAFYTSDQTGKYFGIVQGMTANGDAAAQTFTFEVKADSRP